MSVSHQVLDHFLSNLQAFMGVSSACLGRSFAKNKWWKWFCRPIRSLLIEKVEQRFRRRITLIFKAKETWGRHFEFCYVLLLFYCSGESLFWVCKLEKLHPKAKKSRCGSPVSVSAMQCCWQVEMLSFSHLPKGSWPSPRQRGEPLASTYDYRLLH